MSNGWAQFGSGLLNIFTQAGAAGTAAIAANPNILTQITQLSFNAQNPNASKEDAALAQAMAMFTISPTQALVFIQEAIKLIPPAYLAVSAALGSITKDTPPFQAIQELQMARAELQKPAGS